MHKNVNEVILSDLNLSFDIKFAPSYYIYINVIGNITINDVQNTKTRAFDINVIRMLHS